jgi:hypothetical protein
VRIPPPPECYSREVPSDFDLDEFANAFVAGFAAFKAAGDYLDKCGVPVDQLEGWGFFNSTPSGTRRERLATAIRRRRPANSK